MDGVLFLLTAALLFGAVRGLFGTAFAAVFMGVLAVALVATVVAERRR